MDFLLKREGISLPENFNLHARWVVLRYGIEVDILHATKSLLRRGMVVVDIGANVGLLSRHFGRLVGDEGRVLAFEPDPATCAILRGNVSNMRNVEVSEVAISDREGTVNFHLHPMSATSNSLVNCDPNAKTIFVTSTTLDRWLREHGIGHVDLVKLDVEGAELSVIKGMHETIRRFPALRLIMEFGPANLAAAPGGSQGLLDELAALHLRSQVIQPDGTLVDVASLNEIVPQLNSSGYVNLLCSRS